MLVAGKTVLTVEDPADGQGHDDPVQPPDFAADQAEKEYSEGSSQDR
jgi:hypothetical protein